MSSDMILRLVIGALGGIARSLFHYIKKVNEKPEVKFDIGKLAMSVLRAAFGAALVVSTKTTTNPIMLITAGLTADVIGKDFWSYLQGYFKNKNALIVLLLAGALAFTGAGTATATPEVEIGTDLNNTLLTRASISYQAPQLNREVSFYAEAPLAKQTWGTGTKSWGLTGFNLGLRGRAAGPFYGLVQVNTDRTNDYQISGLEMGVGTTVPFVIGSRLAAELTTENPTLTNPPSFLPTSLSVWLRYSFNILPTTPESAST